MKRVKLADVAEASGVSRATVSFVLNDSPGQTISPQTRERVLAAARELGYVPNGAARALREGTSRTVVLNVVAALEGNYAQSYIRGLGAELEAHGHTLLVRHQAGVEAGDAAELAGATMPRAVLTLGEWYLNGQELDDGGWQHGLAGNTALALEHLRDRGHTAVAMLTPTDAAVRPLVDVRLGFAREAAERLGMAALHRLALPEGRGPAAQALTGLLAASPVITALAGYDDLTALRGLRALADLGLEVPARVAVIGFDGTPYAAASIPVLSTIVIDAEAHGRLAARDILGLDTEGISPAPGRLVVGETT